MLSCDRAFSFPLHLLLFEAYFERDLMWKMQRGENSSESCFHSWYLPSLKSTFNFQYLLFGRYQRMHGIQSEPDQTFSLLSFVSCYWFGLERYSLGIETEDVWKNKEEYESQGWIWMKNTDPRALPPSIFFHSRALAEIVWWCSS